jgi:hypothetical protein
MAPEGEMRTMQTQTKIFGGFVVGAAAGLIASCQTYNFQPVQPLAIAQTTQDTQDVAKALKPNVMIVVDRSGSMTKPTDPCNPVCTWTGATCNNGVPAPNSVPCGTAGGPGACPPGCPTRISDLQTAMSSFLLGDGGTLAQYGLIELPNPITGGSCDSSGVQDIIVQIGDGGFSQSDDPVAEQNAANTIAIDISAITPLGGTPTAATLGALANYEALQDPGRQNFALLLTDGEPNCDYSNPNTCTSSNCQCTFYTGVAPVPMACPGSSCPCGASGSDPNCVIGCIDTGSPASGVVGSITSLRNLKIRTIPVGFGLETLADAGFGTGYAPGALNAMALAGGFARSCPMGTDAECNDNGTVMPGNPLYDTCDLADGMQCGDGTQYCCTRKYYVALDATELETALLAITGSIVNTSPCVYQLEATPTNGSTILVQINGTDVPATAAGTTNWVYTAPSSNSPVPTVTFEGTYCTQLTDATPQNPVNVEFRIVNSL